MPIKSCVFTNQIRRYPPNPLFPQAAPTHTTLTFTISYRPRFSPRIQACLRTPLIEVAFMYVAQCDMIPSEDISPSDFTYLITDPKFSVYLRHLTPLQTEQLVGCPRLFHTINSGDDQTGAIWTFRVLTGPVRSKLNHCIFVFLLLIFRHEAVIGSV